MEEALANVRDAFAAVVELYADQNRALPADVETLAAGEIVRADALGDVA